MYYQIRVGEKFWIENHWAINEDHTIMMSTNEARAKHFEYIEAQIAIDALQKNLIPQYLIEVTIVKKEI